jgi:DNA mismatch repair protein MutS
MADSSTPLMRQYHSVKQQVPGALLFFRLGDFYELFFEDAITAARELEITLTSRNKDAAQPVPMCGVPYHSAESYLARLISKGYRVAICEQMEQPGPGKKIVRREVTRIVTPGTATEANMLRSRENNYLAAVSKNAVAYVDVSTGEFRCTEVANAREVIPLLECLNVREVLVTDPASIDGVGTKTAIDAWVFEPDYAERTLREHFGLLSLDGCGLQGHTQATSAAGAILHYLRDTQKAALTHLERPAYFDRSDAMVLDAVTVRNLELLEPLFAGESRESTLVSVIDATMTGMGARLLRRRLLRPCIDRGRIEARLDAVESLLRDTIQRTEIRKVLSQMLDLERLLAKVTLGTATPRDVLAMGRSLSRVPALNQLRKEEPFDEVAEVRDRILGVLADEPPINVNDGGVIRDGVSAELDELRDISRNSKQYLANMEARERQRTGIASLKVRFNNVFGYYIEISKANLHLAPSDYDRKQTLVGAERFTTPELKELEGKILEAQEKILAIERDLFAEVRSFAAAHAVRLRELAAAVAELDCHAALAQIAADYGYTRPRFDSRGELRIIAGRHPVIERLAQKEAQRFIPNDVSLDPDQRFLAIITGPNMGGKSTYLRQTALIAILAQMGSFIPASEAVLPVVDRVFTRIGAADNLARGRSTFMVEMTETAVILNTATRNSLVILDEIGRGTSTYDGLSLAWAVVEFIHEHVGARTLFATHYHELTELAERLPGVANLHVAVKESGDQILFLRKVQPGAADRSYGIEVARLAALPNAVIERAREILALHERAGHTVVKDAGCDTGPLQIRLFEPVNGDIAGRIRQINLDELRPIEALQLLAELQRDLRTS